MRTTSTTYYTESGSNVGSVVTVQYGRSLRTTFFQKLHTTPIFPSTTYYIFSRYYILHHLVVVQYHIFYSKRFRVGAVFFSQKTFWFFDFEISSIQRKTNSRSSSFLQYSVTTSTCATSGSGNRNKVLGTSLTLLLLLTPNQALPCPAMPCLASLI